MILLNKPLGMTPLEAIREFQRKNPKYQTTKLSFAGRLDPMAEGLLLVLEGEENKDRKRFENLDKTYEFSILFGVTTDTYDLLGKITRFENLKFEIFNFH